jgi:hypothetical protein
MIARRENVTETLFSLPNGIVQNRLNLRKHANSHNGYRRFYSSICATSVMIRVITVRQASHAVQKEAAPKWTKGAAF